MIRYQGFAKRYGDLTAVSSLTLTIEPGEVVALLGPNGSGKSTALKAAAGLLRPSAGAVLLGEPGRPAEDAAARAILSFLPQKVSFPESVAGREVVEFYRRLRGVASERVEEVLRFASLNGASARAVGTYSGGMVQRLGLAVALLPRSPILLLDEPTAALDPDGLCAFYGEVERRRREGQTVFFTSHQLGDVEHLVDRFAVLVEGRLVATLSARELAERLAERGLLRLRVRGLSDEDLAEVQRLAPHATRAGEELVVPGAAAERPAILELLHRRGVTIEHLATEEGRLDGFYRELVKGVA